MLSLRGAEKVLSIVLKKSNWHFWHMRKNYRLFQGLVTLEEWFLWNDFKPSALTVSLSDRIKVIRWCFKLTFYCRCNDSYRAYFAFLFVIICNTIFSSHVKSLRKIVERDLNSALKMQKIFMAYGVTRTSRLEDAWKWNGNGYCYSREERDSFCEF